MNNKVRCEVDNISMAVALASTLIRSIFVLSNRPTFFFSVNSDIDLLTACRVPY